MTDSTEEDENSEPTRQTDRFEWDVIAPLLFRAIVLLVTLLIVLLLGLTFVGVTDHNFASLVVSAVTPLVVVGLGYIFERHIRNLRREHKERIEFTIDANFYGPKKGVFPSEFLIYVHNKSNVKHELNNITLWVRALKREETPTRWTDGPRERELEFPYKLVNDINVIPEKRRPAFIEPDVKQQFTYVTPITERYDYILAHAEFNYIGKPSEKGYEPHSVERMFAVRPTEEPERSA